MNKWMNIIVVGKRHKGIDHLLYSQCFYSITILISILLLFLLLRTLMIKTTESQQKSWFADVLCENVPKSQMMTAVPCQGHEPVRDALTHPIDFWPGSPLLLCCRGGRVQLAEQIPGDCSQQLTDAWSQTLDHFRCWFLSCTSLPL